MWLVICDLSGREVRKLGGPTMRAGEHSFAWDLRDASSARAPAGLYFARLEVDGRVLATGRVVVVR